MKLLSIFRILVIFIFAGHPCNGQHLEGIPSYAPEGYNMEDYGIITKGGDGNFVKGEIVIWKYGFEWNAISNNPPKTIKLIQDKTKMIFVREDPSTVTVFLEGVTASIKKPKNINGIENLFKFVPLKLNQAGKDIIIHRLGQPQKVISTDSENYYLYQRTVTRNRIRYVTAKGTATGTIEGSNRIVDLDTETRIPVEETITYQPYCFKVHFNKKGWVIKVEDLVDRSITWKRK